MAIYNEVLSQVQNLSLADKLRLLEELTTIVRLPLEVEGEEIAVSEAAWQDYLAGRDPGISSKKLKLKLFGEKID